MFIINHIYSSTNLFSETAKRALRENDEGILIDRQKQWTTTNKRQRQSKNRPDVCKYSKMRLGDRYSERENNDIVTLEMNEVAVYKFVIARAVVAEVCLSQTSVTFVGDLAAVRNSGVFAMRELTHRSYPNKRISNLCGCVIPIRVTWKFS